MQKINYSLIISDFDGTLLRSDETIAEETKQAIRNYIDAGGIFGICTGRMLASILPQAKKLGLNGLVASFQGAVITDIQTGKVLVDGYIDTNEAVWICRELEKMNLHIHVYDLNDFYVTTVDQYLIEYERECQVKGKVISEMPLSEYIAKHNIRARKFLTIVPFREKAEVYRKVSELLGEKYYVTYSAANLVEVNNRNYSKGTAVQFMAKYYNIPIEKTIAVGDNFNDVPMIHAAGLGIAVSNADAKLKKSALEWPYSNDENAVGKIIEKYGFCEDRI